MLSSLASGDRPAQERLLELVHQELQGMARAALNRERGDHTLQATALVHEAWMKLVGQDQVNWQGRSHFLGVASIAMRRVLVDHARGKNRLKRGGGMGREELKTSIVDPHSEGASDLDILALHEGLNALAAYSERASRVVELRFFGGVSEPEAAEILGVSRATVTRDWQAAHAWLTNWMDGGKAQ
ncbi:MAG: ECF-type sigma factor [Planctomycetota bacterium]|nr:ECF-type sigma factor [Planctomycetota bacterium]